MGAFPEDTTEVDPERARDLITAGDVQLVDVRQDFEVEAGRLAGSHHIELNGLAAAAETLDRERPLLFYCKTGARSGMATEAFRRAGYQAYNLTGGLVAWTARGLPIEPEDGYVAGT